MTTTPDTPAGSPTEQTERTEQTEQTEQAEPDADRVVRLTVEDGVATVTLDRPDAMNAVDKAMKGQLLAALEQVAGDSAVRCVVLTGQGRAFCVGQDLKEHVAGLQRGDQHLGDTVVEHYNRIIMLLATMNKPVIAALNGVAAGAGASFAFAADIRVIVDTGGINTAFAGIALSCDSGASWSLPRLVGLARAKDLLFFPRTVPAAECLELGLVSRVVSPADFDQTVGDLARTLAQGPTLAYGSIRRAVAASAGQDLPSALGHEAELMTLTGASADHRAAVEAFLTKSRPTYTGQ